MTGNIKYSVSTFGDIPFDQDVNVQLVLAPVDNKKGCEILEKPQNLKALKFVWLVNRGKYRSIDNYFVLLFYTQIV